jgi:hypothetical protein
MHLKIAEVIRKTRSAQARVSKRPDDLCPAQEVDTKSAAFLDVGAPPGGRNSTLDGG